MDDKERERVLELAIDVSSLAADCTAAAESSGDRWRRLMWVGMRTELKTVQNRILGLLPDKPDS